MFSYNESIMGYITGKGFKMELDQTTSKTSMYLTSVALPFWQESLQRSGSRIWAW